MKAAAVCVLACFGLTPEAAGQRETFDVATFQAPAGWERVAGPGAVSYRAKGGTAQMFLFLSRVSSASPEQNFREDWAKLVTAALGKLDMPKPASELRRDGWTAVSGAASKGPGFAVILFTATGFGRAMSIVASVSGQEHLAALRDFFEGLELKGSDGVATPGTLAGLYFQVQTGVLSGARLEVKTRYFLPGNRITRTFPFGGGEKFDVSRCLPDTCGSYAVEAGQLNIRWDNGQADRLSFRPTAEGIQIDGTLFRPARAVSEAALAGEWRGAGQAGNPFSNVYRFDRNGAFTFGTGTGGVGGRYRVQGLTLILNFSDGTESRRTLFATSPSEPAGMICVDGEVYARK